ncbi:DNA-protecting protein DprA, partial [Candidatus Berkelbacteria bacterium]|nr:DNA-protecting protein DprA [Candidatus Berkelbacteria bacterium]
MASLAPIQTLKPDDPHYPPLLKEIYDPPDPLYIMGELPTTWPPLLAAVGSRKATHYGLMATTSLITPVAAGGVGIVSGLALGIDGAAHRAALAGGGITIAVLGTPIDTIYPYQHLGLAKQILASRGLLCSETAPGGETHRGAFPRRNRIIAGMSQATLVVEAAINSGSLITAGCALHENRDVLAVPGPIQSLFSTGTNQLIKLGARPVTEPNDLLEALGLAPANQSTNGASLEGLSPQERLIVVEIPMDQPIHID